MAAGFAPRGFRAALQAEQHLAGSGRGRIRPRTPRQLSPESAAFKQQQQLPWEASPLPATECRNTAQPVPVPRQLASAWLPALLLVACVAFAAGWASGRWRLRRNRQLPKQRIASQPAAAAQQAAAEPMPPTAAAAAASTAPAAMGHAGARQPTSDAVANQSSEPAETTPAATDRVVLQSEPAHESTDTRSPTTQLPAASSTGLESKKVHNAPHTNAASGADAPAPAPGEAAPAAEQSSNSSEPEQQLQQAGKPESGAAEPASSEASEATAWRTSACQAEADEPWQSAAQLVSTVAQRLGIRIDDLSPGEKIQLITAAIGAWQTFQQRDHHRDTATLSAEANVLRSDHNQLVHSGLVDKQARFMSVQAQRGMVQLQQSLADCTLLGLSLMVAAALYCGARHGLLHVRLAACPAVGPMSVSVLRPWEALAPLRAVACWLVTIGDVIFGVLIVLVTVGVLLKTRLLAAYHVMPLNKLLAGLGVVCGALGYAAIGKIGGQPQLWLAMWWLWIGGQCALVMNLAAVHGLLHPAPPPSPASTFRSNGQLRCSTEAEAAAAAAHMRKRLLLATGKALFVVLSAVWYPLYMGCAPFDRSVIGEVRTLVSQT